MGGNGFKVDPVFIQRIGGFILFFPVLLPVCIANQEQYRKKQDETTDLLNKNGIDFVTIATQKTMSNR